MGTLAGVSVSILCPDGVSNTPEPHKASPGLFSLEVGEGPHSLRRPSGQSEGGGRRDHEAPPGWGEWRCRAIAPVSADEA